MGNAQFSRSLSWPSGVRAKHLVRICAAIFVQALSTPAIQRMQRALKLRIDMCLKAQDVEVSFAAVIGLRNTIIMVSQAQRVVSIYGQTFGPCQFPGLLLDLSPMQHLAPLAIHACSVHSLHLHCTCTVVLDWELIF